MKTIAPILEKLSVVLGRHRRGFTTPTDRNNPDNAIRNCPEKDKKSGPLLRHFMGIFLLAMLLAGGEHIFVEGIGIAVPLFFPTGLGILLRLGGLNKEITGSFVLILCGYAFYISAIVIGTRRKSWLIFKLMVVVLLLNIGGCRLGFLGRPDSQRLAHYAIKGDLTGVKRRILLRDDPNEPSRWGFELENKGKTPFTSAALYGHLDVVRYLLEHGAKINQPDGDGETAIIAAAFSGNLALVQYLYSKGADLKITSSSTGDTALHRAAALGHIPIVAFLLEVGVPINSANKLNQTPLMLASINGNVEGVRYLLSRSADRSTISNGDRQTALESVQEIVTCSKRDHDQHSKQGNWSEEKHRKYIGPYEQILELLSTDPVVK